MKQKGGPRFVWAFPLTNAERLPVTGDLHPLRKEAVKWLSWSNGFCLFVAALIFGSWYVWSHSKGDESGPAQMPIVKFVELGVPPSISKASAPQVNVANVAPPAMGIPEPVPEVDATATTIATQSEMAELLAPITMDDLGSGSGDSLVVNVTQEEPSPEDFQVVDEMPIRLSIQPPEYPELAREAGIEGTVVVRALVGKDGKVKKAIIASGGAEILQVAALECAKTAVFKPAIHQNQPVEVWVMMPIDFKLRGD